MISYDEFDRVDLRSGTIIEAEAFPKARNPSYKIWVDFGPEIGVLKTSAQVTKNYSLESLIGKRVIGCVNLGERNIAGFMSQFLLVGFLDDANAVCLATFDQTIANGQKLH